MALGIACTSQWSSDMIARELQTSVICVHFDGAQGSAVATHIDGRQYLLTARHVVEGMAARGSIGVEEGGDLRRVAVRRIDLEPSDADVDLVALAPDSMIAEIGMVPVVDTAHVGQEVYFLGFPHGRATLVPPTLHVRPLPLAKRGIVAGFHLPRPGRSAMVIDGVINDGYSGGGVFGVDAGSGQARWLLAIIEAFDLEPAAGPHGPLADVRVNSGLFRAWQLAPILEAVRSHPIGPPVR